MARRDEKKAGDQPQAWWGASPLGCSIHRPTQPERQGLEIMNNEEMQLVNDNGTWKIKWNDGFERSFESFFKAKLHFVALVNQQIAMER